MHSLSDDEKFGDAPCVVVLKRLPIDNLVKHQTACELDKDDRDINREPVRFQAVHRRACPATLSVAS